MAIQKENVSIDVQDIIELLHSGYTWYKKDDLGYGSIQEKFNALDIHIKTIQKHPELKDVDTIAKVFVITNRNKQTNGTGTTTNTVNNSTDGISMASLLKPEQTSDTRMPGETSLPTISDTAVEGRRDKVLTQDTTATSDLSAFASL
jgi:hypothetical protein